jgi:hypothetical protein
MTRQLKRLRSVVLLAALCGGGAFALFTVMTWPSMFVSQGRVLMGASLELQESARFDRGSREGRAAWIYRVSGEAADDLSNDPQSLKAYPMWCALAFDGYKRVRWQTIAELKAGPDRILADRALPSEAGDIDAAQVQSLEDAQQLAASLSNQEGVLVAGWYTTSGGVVTNYFVYVLDLKRRMLVKLSLLT